MIAAQLAETLARRFVEAGGGDLPLARFREEHPDLRFFACSEDDIPARLNPWVSVAGAAVYLMDATDHCVRLSRDPEQACGLVFALEAGE